MSTVTSSSPPLQIDWDDVPPAGHPSNPGTGPGRVTVRQRTGLTSAASWRELVYAVLDLAPAVAFFSVIVTLLAVGAGLTVVYVGIPVLIVALLIARLGGAAQIVLAGSLLGVPVLVPGPFVRVRPGFAGMLGAVLTDGAAWRAVLYFVIKIALAPVTFAVAVGTYSYGLGAVSYLIWGGFLPAVQSADGAWHRLPVMGFGPMSDTWWGTAALAVVGLLVLLAAPHVLRWFLAVDRVLVTGLLGRR